MPPVSDSVIDSVSTCDMMSRRFAPSALRSPISRVRSLTTISMMFMMTMPPTTSDKRDDADQHGEDPGGRLVVDVEHRIGADDAEVVGLGRLEPPPHAQRHARIVLGRLDQRRVARLDHHLQRLTRAEQLAERAEGNRRRTSPSSCRRSRPSFR